MIIKLKGKNGLLELYDDKIILKRGNSLFGENKTIYLNRIIKIYFQPGKLLSDGFIQLVLKEEKIERKSISKVIKDKNSIVFTNKYNQIAQEIVENIEAYLKIKNESSITLGVADEIRKYKELYDEDIITKKEFDLKRDELLKLNMEIFETKEVNFKEKPLYDFDYKDLKINFSFFRKHEMLTGFLVVIIAAFIFIPGNNSKDNKKERLIEEDNTFINVDPTTNIEETRKVEVENVEYIIGSKRESVKKLMIKKGYIIDDKYTTNVNSSAIELEKDNLGMLVYFNEDDIAIGVYVNSWDGDFVTGENSSVALYYDELILLASKNPEIMVTNDLIKYNSTGTLKFPTVLLIGEVPED